MKLHVGKKEVEGVKAGWAHVSVWSDGKVQLRGGYQGFLDATKDDVTISKDVCTGTKTTVGSHQRTVPPEATGNMETRGTEEDKHHWVTLPALPHNLGMAVQDTVAENGLLIEGDEPIEKKREMDGAYEEETHASWTLTGRDPCE